MKRTLGLRVAGAILVTFAAITVVFCVVGAPLESRWARDRERMVLTVLESLVAQEGNDLASDLFERRVTAAQLRVQRLLGVQGVQGVALFDHTGSVVTRAYKGSGPGEVKPVTLKPAVNAPQLRENGARGLLRYEQVLLVVGEPVGSLQLTYDASWLHQQSRTFYMLCGGLLLATLAGMLTVLRWLLHRQVVAPVVALRDAVRTLHPGEPVLFEKTPAMGSEVAELAESIQDMAQRLTVAHRELHDRSVRLTASLERSSSLLQELDARNRELLQRNAACVHAEDAQREQRALMQQVVNALPAALFAVENAGRVVLMNEAAEALAGWTFSAAEGRVLDEVLPDLAHICRDAWLRTPAGNCSAEKVCYGVGADVVELGIAVFPLAGERGAVIRIERAVAEGACAAPSGVAVPVA